jgi:LmbE family N-acetylglucosaminyl deacetylase
MRKPCLILKFVLTAAPALAACCLLTVSIAAQDSSGTPEKVLTLLEERSGPRALPQDQGSSGLWQQLLKLRTTASVLYTAAHPDDEQGGTLTYLSRGQGVRTSLLTLNRGEGGANAIGPELFEGLGLIRTEELRVSGRYYGLDDQYFSTMIDYGYSKSLDEALDQWGKENVLRDVVRVIRINRPLVIVSRFHGSERDGHGNHQTSGLISQQAFEVAGDPDQFPEQIRQEGLRPWQPLKMYRSNLRPRRLVGGDDPPQARWNVRVDAGSYSPWLGQTYQNFASLGLSFQRSQNSGRLREIVGAYPQYFERLHSKVEAPEEEESFFDGIDTSISGIFNLLGETAPPGVLPLLRAAEGQFDDAFATFNIQNPSAVVPFLTIGLGKVRQAIRLVGEEPDALFLLQIKERQLMDAITTALGIGFSAVAVPADSEPASSTRRATPTMGVIVPGQQFRVEVTLISPSHLSVEAERITLEGAPDWIIDGGTRGKKDLAANQKTIELFMVTVPANAELSRRYFYRDSVRDNRYQIRDPEHLHLPARKPALVAAAQYTINGEMVEIRERVHTHEANLPYGHEWRELKVAPSVVVNLRPETVVVSLESKSKVLTLQVELLNNQAGGVSGEVTLETPSGWTVRPSQHHFQFAQAGERNNYAFSVSFARLEDQTYQIQAVAAVQGKEHREGYDIIRHRDYDTNYLYRESIAEVLGVDVRMAPDLKVGYVMGVGDKVPEGIEQLGAQVQLLTSDDLASGQLRQFDSIVVGTRAYAVRPDLITYNQRLLDYAQGGGNLIILYQTQEFVPTKWAAYPAELPQGAEEVSEEDSPVKILAASHDAFNRPNKISGADFDNWVEQRGSKFFSQWDSNYTPMIETQDRGQEPQQGGWLTARYGRGYYTYFAYAVHRQLPYGVSGAYRIFANVLSLGNQ